MPDRILVTGANGFVGQALVKALVSSAPRVGGVTGPRAGGPETSRREWQAVRAAFRSGSWTAPEDVESVVVGEIGGQTDWSAALYGVDCIVHLAARVHVLHDKAANPLAHYRETNVNGTLNLARQAARVGVKRFVYLSSIKVNGNASEPGRPFTEADPPAADAHLEDYDRSKLEAERGLTDLAGQTDLDVVIIRPPLVYGPGVKANFAALMRAVARGIPLPLASVQNSRSLVGVDNLVDFIIVCASDRAAANELFLVSDGEDLSTPELIRRIGTALGHNARLIRCPIAVLEALARVAGLGEISTRLLGTLCLDIGKAERVLNWQPPIGVNEGLYRVATEFHDMTR